ncbi:DUF4157 domain-containing protein [Sphingomonas sp. 2R-10]|uniref:eCIS core domain-containing protein n=1 Tax=Sphingomonas sp. 2R-10 TaxID=3045148 RepID=UPI000F7B3041|nr:DUF4157 domain-containing protein [Sphingomonas sp. 2R-10]MDJ0278171.1 DUF4157 domain-containing protein [Sphingomonas sp. 2R-10]
MIDPLEEFRRAAAGVLARMERRFVESALALPGYVFDKAADATRKMVVNEVQQRLDAAKMLSRLPHHLADMLADSWRGPGARMLTARERLLIVDVYGHRARPDLIRIVDGPGLSEIPRIAFRNNNGAITIGNTIYLNPARKYPTQDLTSKKGEGTELLIHEVMHTIQYRELGYARFLTRYGNDMATVKGDANEMYNYFKRRRTFGNEMLEGQAEMVGRYQELRDVPNPKLDGVRDDLRRRLKGTGLHGL